MRNEVINKIYDLMKKNKKIFFLTADMGINLVEKIQKDYPKRYLNVGISEQNLISISAGLANLGFIPVAYTVSNFLVHRCFEQIRNDIVIHNYSIILLGTSSGYDNAPLGPTHHIIDDWGHLKNFNKFEIYAPVSCNFAVTKVEEVLNFPRSCYFRLAKGDFNEIKETKNFYFSKTDSEDFTLFISYGNLTETLLKLKNECSKNIMLLNKIHPIIDNNEIINVIKNFKKLVIVEDHFSISGIYSTFCLIKNKCSLNLEIVNFSPNSYDLKVGKSQEYYLKKNRLDFNSLKNYIS